jgi:signal transduction histidine kinase
MSLSTNAAADEALVRFARKISHDLNNYSTVVRTYSELLLSDLPPDSATYADVAEIQRAAENMVQYLQRVTRFARAGAMKRAPVDADAVAQEAVQAFATAVPARPVQLDGNSRAIIQADPLWWRDVLLELLQNAHEASPAGRPVTLRTRAADGVFAVAVIDEGAGFPEELAGEVTAPLVTAKSGVRGAGMGLAIVAAFVGALGGTMSHSRDGTRTVVELRLPAT